MRRTLCVGLDLLLLLHLRLVLLVLVLRGTRVQRERVVQVQAQRVPRGRAMMDMVRQRSSFTSLAVRVLLPRFWFFFNIFWLIGGD